MRVESEFPQSFDRCAYYGRVSTPRQKLEHQREHVFRWCEQQGVQIPAHLRFEDKEKRHRSDKREDFQRLLEVCRRGELDWIVICSFDRWGVADPDEFSEFRRQLRRYDVQLWSVVDHLNLTSLNEGDYFRIVALAVGATRYVEQMAEKNILKMIEMAKQGWAATGNAPYGTDLVCYPLHDLTKPLFRVVRLRYKAPHLYRTIYTDGREDVSERMPPRDKKATGYRFEPSICDDRLQAVRQMYELYDSGMGFTDISEALWKQGLKHYDKPFGYHGVETILSNPVYIGEPAWGKLGVGAYYILHDGQPKKVRRKSSDTLVIKKAEAEYARPLKPIFAPIVPPDLWQRVHDRLAERAHVNPSFGKRRTKSRAKHPLNGKLFCPDCGEPMVFGSTMSKGKTKRYYICGTYRKTQRKKCRANSIPWSKIDKAIETLLATVRDRLAALTTAEPKAAETVLKEKWAKETELGRLIYRIVNIAFHQTDSELLDDESERNENIFEFVKGQLAEGKHPTAGGNEKAGTFDEEKGEWIGWDMPTFLSLAFEFYNRTFEESVKDLRKELGSIDAELARIAKAIMDGIPSETVRRTLNARMGELEGRKRELEPRLVPLTGTAQALIDQLHAIRETVEQTDTVAKAKLLDSFVERVVPHFQEDAGQRKERDVTFEFVPMHAARNVLPEPMKVRGDRTDRGSWPQRGRNGQGMSLNTARGRW
jgi:DNA invertase Pin-like site-specific DNA recombinase